MSNDSWNGDTDPTKLNPAVLANFPALTPPPGVTPNFVNPPSWEKMGRDSIYSLMPLTVCFVSLRIYSRARISRKFGLDDWTCLAATISTLETILYALEALLIKTSILLLYLRFFLPSQLARYMIWVGLVLNGIFYLSVLVADIVLCVPRRGEHWISAASKQRCAQPELNLSVGQGIFGVISDSYLLSIPLIQVMKLHVSRARKVGLTAVFLTGLLAVIFSLVTCIYRFQQRGSDDFTWRAVPVYAFCAAEVGVGIICSCMPVIFVLFKEAFQKIQIKLPSLYYSRFRRGAKGTSSEDSLRLAQQPREQEELAAVPKGTMITLRSIIKNVFGSTTENGTREDEVVLSNMSNFDAGRDTYHARLRDIGSRGEI